MESENSPVSNNSEEKQKKKGLQILGYVVPWWAVVLVILVALYFAYERGYLVGILGDIAKPERQIELKGPVKMIEVDSAPAEIKRLFIRG